MSPAGMAGMQLAGQEILTIGETLDTDQWQLPSAATGWSVQDVVVHTGCLLGPLTAAVGGEVVPETGIEALNDIQVAEKRGWNSAQANEALQQNLDKALAVFAPLQDEPLATVEIQMLDLGSYPLHSIVDMFTFDLTTHLRYDILTPRGPVDRHLPPLGEAQLVPAVSCLLGGIPKMQPDLPQLDPTDIENRWRESLLDVREAVRTGGLDQTGPAGGLYDECLFQHEPGQATVFIPVTTPRELGRIEPILVPAAEVAVTTHYGSTADIDLAYAELGSYIARQELAVGPRIREYYHRDHTHTTDHTQWRTEVAWPIIDVLTPKA